MSIKQGNNTIAGGVIVDNTPTSGSNNAVSSGGVYTALGGKADIDASNFDATGKSTIAGLGMPSSTYDELTAGASGTTYTAPANGWFCASLGAGSLVIQYQNSSDDWVFGICSAVVSGFAGGRAILPVKKNDIIALYYTGGTIDKFRFVYAQGEAN